MRALGRLLRLSLAPSAIADVAAGTVLGAGAWPGGARPFVLCAASLALYHGGMALNDWADRAHDARTRPARPIPAGEVPARAALGLGLVLLGTGVALATLVSWLHGAIALALALVVLAYDLGSRPALGGPLGLAAARALNLTLGIVLGASEPGGAGLSPPALVVAALGYGAYVFLVSRLGRLEDRLVMPRPGRTRRLLSSAAFTLWLLPLAVCLVDVSFGPPETSPTFAIAFVATLLAARGLWRAGKRDPRHPDEILPAMGMALRRLIVATASLAILPGTTSAIVVSALLFAGYPLSHALRRVFPPS